MHGALALWKLWNRKKKKKTTLTSDIDLVSEVIEIYFNIWPYRNNFVI